MKLNFRYFLSKKPLILMALLLTILFSNCSNPEGKGGELTLTGQVIARKYNLTFTNLIAEYPLHEERVYIIYGNDEIYSDDFRTDFQGRYRFENLQPGKYTIFAYARDSTGNQPSGETPVFVEVNLTSNNPATEAPILILNK
jgi:hypothetical protein